MSENPNPALTPEIPLDIALDRTIVTSTTERVHSTLKPVQDRIGKYNICKKLGEGGMGAVYQAKDTESGQDVALKVLSAGYLEQADALRRFEKEARLLEEAKSPFVANLIEIGIEGDLRYLVMEFVGGGDLRQRIKNVGKLDEPSALEIIGDVCRALVTAHSKGMVHRDIKPENILLDEDPDTHRTIVKLTDFGLARHIDQSESLKLTQTGALLGTPYYMSPEQFTGAHEVSPATDVYAIGATFYELVTGDRPFTANDPIQLATAHVFETPTDVRKLNPEISDTTANLIGRMLAKQPGHRPPDSSAVLEEILQLQTGSSSGFVVHPILPAHDSEKVYYTKFEWNLASSPAALWPYVSNTDRFNRAAGISPITYETTTDPQGQNHKFGSFSLAGMTIRWEEHPFEWIEGHRFSVVREFPSGPFQWFMSSVELHPDTGGGTRLIHEVKIQSRGVIGQVLAQIEVGIKAKRNFTRIYQRIDQTLAGKTSTSRVVDPFVEPDGLKRIQLQRLQSRLDEWSAAGTSTDIVEAFSEYLTNASAQDLSRIRPNSIARRFGLPEQDVIEACLRAVPIGLLTLYWDIICPTCRLATGAKETLREIEEHGSCSACQTKFDVDFSNSLELIFRPHPEIRSADAKTYCAGGPGNFPHVVAQVRLKPTERLLLPLALTEGSYVVRGPGLPYAIPVDVDRDHGTRHGQIRCLPVRNQTPVTALKAGHQNLALENFFPIEQVVRLERTTRRSEALTAAQVTTLPLFRQLFPDQTLAPGRLVQVATATFLAIQIADIDKLFQDFGDAGTYSILKDFRRSIERHIQQQGGCIVDELTGLLVASFPDPMIALKTAGELTDRLMIELPQRQWSLSGGLHRGAALVMGDRYETKYFGATINRTLQLARTSQANELLLSDTVWSDPGVKTQFQRLWDEDVVLQKSVDPSVRLIHLDAINTLVIKPLSD